MSGSDWLKSQKTLSPFGEIVADLLGELYSGIYHIDREVLKSDFTGNKHISVVVSDGRGSFATFDSDLLTRLVILAHEKNVRASVRAAAHGYLRLEFMCVDRTGFFADRHPTLGETMKRLGKDFV